MKLISDLQIGKAGEYLVCADLILNGHIAFPSEQGLPFDVILEYNHRLLKIQVKSTRGPKSIPQRKTDISAYIFHIGTNGKMKNGKRRNKYESTQVDIFALVALETKHIAYLPHFDTQTTMNFRVPANRGLYHDEQGFRLKVEIDAMRAKKMKCQEIADVLKCPISLIHSYTKARKPQKGTNAGVYFDDFTLDRCLAQITKQ